MPTLFRLSAITLALACITLSAAEGDPPKTQNVDLGWCKVVMPMTVRVNEPATFQVTLTKVPDGAAKIKLDLHWIDTSGANKGMNTAGPAKDVVLNQVIEWNIVTKEKELIGKVLPIMYLTTDGSWKGLVGDKPPKLPTIEVVK